MNPQPINILIIHQSAELYGSDKTLLYFLQNCDKSKIKATVVLPFHGPLKKELEKYKIKVIILPVLKLYRKMITPKNGIKFVKEYITGYKELKKLHKENTFDLVYSNTLAVLLGFIFAKQCKIKHLWHIHEIIEKPILFKKIFQKLLRSKTNTGLIFNSVATKNFWNVNGNQRVVLNGVDAIETVLNEETKKEIRKTYFQANDEIVIGLIGRISRWKGQQLLLEAFYELQKTNKKCKLVFIGSPPPGQQDFLNILQERIVELKLESKVTVIDFQKNIKDFQQALDIIVVPSIEPEPFGLVAIEGMFAQKPIVGANHGGLTEIIIHKKTGLLFEPNNLNELYSCMHDLIQNESWRIELGANGLKRANECFSTTKYVQQLENAIITL